MTPLILLVGFLGAGKTTYLRQILPALSAHRLEPHVIINDYQNARVDAELLRELTSSIVPISGNCVCCGSQDELLAALEGFDHQPGRVVLLEANGTTDAEELVELLSLEPALNAFTQPVQVSIIDGKRWQKRFWHNALELAQLKTATYRYVSRSGEIDAARRQQVEASLARHGILAPETAPGELAAEIAGIAAAVRHLAGRDAVAHPHDCDCHAHDHHAAPGHEHDHHGHDHHDHGHDADAHHFASMQILLPAVVERGTLADFLAALPPETLRVKGLARLADSPEEFHVFQRVEDAPVQWLPIGRESRLPQPLAVIIGPTLDAAAIRARAERAFGPEPAVTA